MKRPVEFGAVDQVPHSIRAREQGKVAAVLAAGAHDANEPKGPSGLSATATPTLAARYAASSA